MRGYLGLGSNAGDRLAALRAARDAVGRQGVEVVRSSSVYETAPQGPVRNQADFLNACLAIETALCAEELLATCKEVERRLGRRPGGLPQGPRAIDLDVLMLGELEQRSERLVLPHPKIRARRFVLEPLLELDPALTLPDGTALAPLLEGLGAQRVTRLGPL